MSSISAGTSAGTALVQTGDTSGALVIKTGGSGTTAATFNADQTTTFAGAVSAPSFSGTSSTATNLAGGSAGTIPYQSAAGTTAMLSAGTSGYLLQSNGAAAPSWVAPVAAAGTVTAVASGSLSDGSMVILNSDGTVTAGAATAATSFTQIAYGVGTGTVASAEYSVATTYGVTDNRIVIFWIRNSDKYLMATVGAISGSTITFGTATVIYSSYCDWTYAYGLSSAWDPISNRYYCLYRQNSTQSGGCISVSVNTTTNIPTVVTNSASAWAGSGAGPYGYQIAIGGNKIVVAYGNVSANNQYVTVGTISGTSVSFGSSTANLVNSGNVWTSRAGVAFSADASEFVVAFSGNSGYAYVKRGTISGTTVTFGSDVTVTTSNAGSFPKCVTYATQQQKYFVMYGTNANDVYGAVVTSSGGTLTVGTPAVWGAGYASYFPYSIVYYATTGRVMGMPGYGVLIATISGTTFTSIDPGFPAIDSFATCVFNSFNDSVVTCGTSLAAYADTAYTTNITSTNFLGVSNGAYTNGQTATIQTVGSTDDAQSGLTPGLKYYVSPGGLLSLGSSYPYAGLALTTTKLVIKG